VRSGERAGSVRSRRASPLWRSFCCRAARRPQNEDITEFSRGDAVACVDYNLGTAIIVEHKQFAAFQEKLFVLLYRTL
jgi:hypothetical protein